MHLIKKKGSNLCNEEVHPGQQVDEDQAKDKQIIDLRLDWTQESIHGSQGQELPRTTKRRREGEEQKEKRDERRRRGGEEGGGEKDALQKDRKQLQYKQWYTNFSMIYHHLLP